MFSWFSRGAYVIAKSPTVRHVGTSILQNAGQDAFEAVTDRRPNTRASGYDLPYTLARGMLKLWFKERQSRVPRLALPPAPSRNQPTATELRHAQLEQSRLVRDMIDQYTRPPTTIAPTTIAPTATLAAATSVSRPRSRSEGSGHATRSDSRGGRLGDGPTGTPTAATPVARPRSRSEGSGQALRSGSRGGRLGDGPTNFTLNSPRR